jgi:two-component system, LytTR family, response regulator
MIASPTLRVVVVDDEAPARRKILRLLREESDVEIVGEADNGQSAIAAIEKHHPDLVFLDVQMVGMDGFAVIRSLSSSNTPMPRIVFVTAHDQYALHAFEVHACDYLLKPVSNDRFREAVRRVRRQHENSTDVFARRLCEMLEQMQREKSYPDRLLVREEDRAFFVPIRAISWIEADRNYVIIHCGTQKHALRGTVELLQNTLDPKIFVRINRKNLVRVDAIRELLPWFHGEYKILLHDNTELRWSRHYVGQRPELLKLL